METKTEQLMTELTTKLSSPLGLSVLAQTKGWLKTNEAKTLEYYEQLPSLDSTCFVGGRQVQKRVRVGVYSFNPEQVARLSELAIDKGCSFPSSGKANLSLFFDWAAENATK